jgi:UDP-N-acetylmuramoyl-tripeptide--D-alanyl-D-alanine ligase
LQSESLDPSPESRAPSPDPRCEGMKLTLREIAAVLGASSGEPGRAVAGYSIDSRTLQPGQLFFAIRGPRFDAHQFVPQALERGAAGAVVEEAFRAQCSPELASAMVFVPDPARALQQLAQEVRHRWGKRLVAVTGSTGKTTTKEWIAALLAQRFAVLKSPGNLNNDYGLPLALLGLELQHEVAVMELAMSAAGEIGRLARIAAPQVGVVTNVAPVHLQFFDSVDSIALAKRELIENLAPPATAVLNFDDHRVRAFSRGFAGRVLTFGFQEGAEFRARQVERLPGGGSRFRVEGGLEGTFDLPLPGRHNVQNALAALAAASLFGITAQEAARALAGAATLPQRGEIITLPDDITLLNDSYNSNPLALVRMLETLEVWPGARRRVVVAGEMLELGAGSPSWHRNAGRQCAQARVDWLVAVQGEARYFLEGAREAGLPGERMRFFATAQEAGEFCATLVASGDVVLVKGSRGVHLEKVVELLVSSRETSAARRHTDRAAD